MSIVSVTWFDKDEVWRAVEAHARALAARHPEIEEIRVFGSLVKGTAVPGSDVDLLIIQSGSDRPFLDRSPAYLPGAFPCGVDVFPYTRAEIARMTTTVPMSSASRLVSGTSRVSTTQSCSMIIMWFLNDTP